MKRFWSLFKDLIVGGLVFLLPVGIVLVVFGKLFAIAARVSDWLHRQVIPGEASDVVILIIAILILLAIALGAGMISKTKFGIAAFAWFDDTILCRVPMYSMVRQVIVDMTGGADHLSGDKNVRVVAVAFDDQTQIGFAVDQTSNGQIVVYLPGAPSAMSGTVSIVEPSRVKPTNLTTAQVITGMKRLGAGINAGKA